MPPIYTGPTANQKQLPKWTKPDSGADVTSFDASGGLEAGAKAGASIIPSLISIYRDRAAREAAVEEFRNSIKVVSDQLSSKVGSSWSMAGDWLAQRYPNIAAHMYNVPHITNGNIPGLKAEAMTSLPRGPVMDPIPLHLFEHGVTRINEDPSMARNYMAHEATHVAQALGNSDMGNLYESAGHIAGYSGNPFEVSARSVGAKAQYGLRGKRAVPAVHALGYPQTADNPDRINNILDVYRRGNTDLIKSVYPPIPGMSKQLQNLVEVGKARLKDYNQGFISNLLPNTNRTLLNSSVRDIEDILKKRSK